MDDTPRSALSVIARILAVLLAALFALTSLIALVLFNVERRAFNPATYKRALINQNFYQKLPTLLGDLLTKNMSHDAPAFAQHMTADNWKTLLDALLPQQELQAMTEETINQVFAYLNGETLTPQISLTPLKRNLAGPAGTDRQSPHELRTRTLQSTAGNARCSASRHSRAASGHHRRDPGRGFAHQQPGCLTAPRSSGTEDAPPVDAAQPAHPFRAAPAHYSAHGADV